MSAIDLYAVLGVARDASTDEIREAWQNAVAGLGPTDPTFNVLNQAGAVLGHDRFVQARRWAPLTVIVTYHLAQVLIVVALFR